MESHIQSVMARIQEIQARIGSLQTPAPPGMSPSAASGGAAPANNVFPVMLAQANGSVKLRPLAGEAGPFTPQIEDLIARYAQQNGLKPELARAVVQQESGGDPRCVSAVGAKGLMQLMPETWKTYGVTDPFDPEQNISAGTRHLAGLLREFNGDVSLALAAYNAGSGAVRKYGGVPPYAETQQYVRRITGMMDR